MLLPHFIDGEMEAQRCYVMNISPGSKSFLLYISCCPESANYHSSKMFRMGLSLLGGKMEIRMWIKLKTFPKPRKAPLEIVCHHY